MAAPIAGRITYHQWRRNALVAIRMMVGMGSRCSLPRKIVVNRGSTKHSRKMVTLTAITAMITG